VIVKNEKIIGQGYHRQYGGAHAEVEAINSCQQNLSGSTIYVSLEPCCHFGKTPPCTQAIIKAKIKKVICITTDPNPKVSGHGLDQLRQAGIEVEINNELEEDARRLNESFFTFFEENRPFVVLKFAASLDGKIATTAHESKWITNEAARLYARELRGQYQAILVGANTVIADNPHLGTRLKNGRDPIRIIIDPELSLPLNSHVLRDNNILIFTTKFCDKNKKKELEKRGIELISSNKKLISIKQILSQLTKKNILSVMVEGGSQTIGNFVDSKIIDKVYAFYAPIIIGGQSALSAVGGKGTKKIKDCLNLEKTIIKKIGDNFLVTGYSARRLKNRRTK